MEKFNDTYLVQTISDIFFGENLQKKNLTKYKHLIDLIVMIAGIFNSFSSFVLNQSLFFFKMALVTFQHVDIDAFYFSLHVT